MVKGLLEVWKEFLEKVREGYLAQTQGAPKVGLSSKVQQREKLNEIDTLSGTWYGLLEI